MKTRYEALIVWGLFFLSGLAGLCYESIVASYLKIIFGHAAYGQIMTLCCFMGGIGIGSIYISRKIDKIQDPFKIYVFVELGIACFALALHPVFEWGREFVFSYRSMMANWTVDLVNCLFGVMLVVPMAVLIGMTFPLVAEGLMRRGWRERLILSGLYFSNSLGGAFGVLLCSFCFIPRFGLPGTLAIGAMLNLFLAGSFYIALVRSGKGALSESLSRQGGLISWVGMVALFTGLSSFIYEIVWIRLNALVFGGSNHTFEIMLSCFIFGLACGALFIMGPVGKWIKSSYRLLFCAQVFMGLSAIVSMLLYKQWFGFVEYLNAVIVANDAGYVLSLCLKFCAVMAQTFPVAFFAGMTLPLLTEISLKEGFGDRSVGWIYGLNTVGAIIGASVGGIIILPIAGLSRTMFVGAAIDLLLALVVLYVVKASRFRVYSFMGAIVLLGSWLFLGFEMDPKILVQCAYRGKVIRYDSVDVKDGATATISVGRIGESIVLGTNGKPDASLSVRKAANPDNMTQSALAWYPMASQKNDYSAAMIGLGCGATAHYFLADPRLKKLDVIEIESRVFEMSSRFRPGNERIFSDKRFSIAIQDARIFFGRNQKKYDLVVSEPSNPWVSGVAGLFSIEFYKDVSRVLTDDGVLCQWLHLYEFDDRLFSSISQALLKEFPYVQVYQPGLNPDVVMIASKRPIKMSKIPLESGLVAKDIASIGESPTRLLSQMVSTEKTLSAFSGFSPVNSEYYPYVEYRAQEAFFLKSVVSMFSIMINPKIRAFDVIEGYRFVDMNASSNSQSAIADAATYLAGIRALKNTVSSAWIDELPARLSTSLWPKLATSDSLFKSLLDTMTFSNNIRSRSKNVYLMRYYSAAAQVDSLSKYTSLVLGDGMDSKGLIFEAAANLVYSANRDSLQGKLEGIQSLSKLDTIQSRILNRMLIAKLGNATNP